MELNLLLFGITKDIMGGDTYQVMLKDGDQVGDLRKILLEKYPQMQKLRSLMIAVNDEYAQDDLVLSCNDEVALIPPVSGG